MTLSPLTYTVIVASIVVFGVARALLDQRKPFDRIFHWTGRVEIATITLLLATLVIIGFLQIVLRNLFNSGILWADPLMRHLVLWLGCFGAAFATARGRHINIDVFGRILPPALKLPRRVIVNGAMATAATFLCIATLRLVIDEKEFGEMAFVGLQTWVLQTVLPFAFFVIAYRSVTNIIIDREAITGDTELEFDA